MIKLLFLSLTTIVGLGECYLIYLISRVFTGVRLVRLQRSIANKMICKQGGYIFLNIQEVSSITPPHFS